MILLDEELAIVVDSITTKNTSPISKVATIFNNAFNTFNLYKHKSASRDLHGFQMTKEERKYHAIWINKGGLNPEPNITRLTYKSQGNTLPVSNVNITFPIVDNHSLAAFCFFSSNVKIKNMNMFEKDNFKVLAIDIYKRGQHQRFVIEIDSEFKDIRIKRTDRDSSKRPEGFSLYTLMIIVTGLIFFRITYRSMRNWVYWKFGSGK